MYRVSETMAEGQEMFAARVARLEAQGVAHNQMYLNATTQTGLGAQLGALSALICAAFLGFISIVAARYVLFLTQGEPNPAADIHVTFLTETCIALAFCFVGSALLKLRAPLHMVIINVFFWGTMVAMHNLVHAFPEIWSNLFSERWVWVVTQMTEPASIRFYGESHSIAGLLPELAGQDRPAEIKINRF